MPAPFCTSSVPLSYRPSDRSSLKDFALVHDGDRFHLFATRPGAGWSSGGGVDFEHASSPDLAEWTAHERIDLRQPAVAETETWAPHVVRHDGRWWMFYTGVVYRPGAEAHNVQRILSAVSDDLHTWQPTPMVLEGDPSFSLWGAGEPWGDDLRDPMLWYDDGEWVLFVTVRLHDERQCIATARSTDLQQWNWGRPLLVTAGPVAESPTLTRYRGRFWLFWTSRDRLRAASADAPEGPYTAEDLDVRGFACESLGLGDGSVLLPRVRSHAISFGRLQPADVSPPAESTTVSPLCFDRSLLVPGPTVLSRHD
ncbi:MAG TPA: family 43 glycosylhydrolase [Candidatus Krumholzibacteria bacterium]|nr:family 43 glycosylhydrolase [Candidatus Krumholzibacteria bacterium]